MADTQTTTPPSHVGKIKAPITPRQERRIQRALDQHVPRSRSAGTPRSHSPYPSVGNSQGQGQPRSRSCVTFDENVRVRLFKNDDVSTSSDDDHSDNGRDERASNPLHDGAITQVQAYLFSLWTFFSMLPTHIATAWATTRPQRTQLWALFKLRLPLLWRSAYWMLVLGLMVGLVGIVIVPAAGLLTASIRFLVQVLALACWGLGQVWTCGIYLLVGGNDDGSGGFRGGAMPGTTPTTAVTAAIPLPIATLGAIRGPQLGDRMRDLNSRNEDDVGQDWVGINVLGELIGSISGIHGMQVNTVAVCKKGGSVLSETEELTCDLHNVLGSRRKQARTTRKLCNDIHSPLSRAYETMQTLQRQIETSPALLLHSARPSDTEGKKKMKKNTRRVGSRIWTPGWVQDLLAKEVAKYWLQMQLDASRITTQRCDRLVAATQAMEKAFENSAISDLQCNIESDSKKQANLVHKILWQETNTGLMGDDHDHEELVDKGHYQQQQTGVNTYHSEVLDQVQGQAKVSSHHAMLVSHLSEALDALDIALSYDTTQLKTWINSLTSTATQASRLTEQASAIQREAKATSKAVDRKLKQLRADTEGQGGSWVSWRRWWWQLKLIFNPLVDWDLNLDSEEWDLTRGPVGSGWGREQWFVEVVAIIGDYEEWVANMNRWEASLLAVTRDSQALLKKLEK